MMKRAVLYIFALFYVSPLLAKPITVTNDECQPLNSAVDFTEVFHEVDFKEVRRDDFFKASEKKTLKDKDQTRVWFRFQVKNHSHPQLLYLLLMHPRLDHAAFYDPQTDGSYIKKIAGDRHPYDQWSEKYAHPVFHFFLDTNQGKTLYFYIDTTSQAVFRMKVCTSRAFGSLELSENFIYIVNFFATIIFILAVIYFYRQNKNPRLLLAIPLSMIKSFFLFLNFGNSYPLWPESPYIQDRILFFTITISTIISFLFTLKHLSLKERMKWMHRVFLCMIFLSLPHLFLLYKMTFFFRHYTAAHVALGSILVTVTAFLIWRKGYSHAKYFFYFNVIIQLGNLLQILNFFELLDPAKWRLNWPAYFYPVGLLVLAIGGVDKFRELQAERDKLEETYNALISEGTTEGKKSRIDALDTEKLLQKISQLVQSDLFFDKELFTLKKMAKALEIRPDQLSELLNKEMNVRFNHFVNTIRVRKACDLMADFPDKSITWIYFESGFNSKAPFYNAFREIMSISPTDYRSALQNTSQKKSA